VFALAFPGAPRTGRPRRTGTMHHLLDELIGPSATNWLIVAVAALVILGAITLVPELVRRLFRKGREPLL
jgi:hypothetical protein